MMTPEINRKILIPVILLGAFLSILNQTILNVALPELMEEFNIGPTTVQWLITGFMLVNGVLVPITAFLMKRFTTRQLFLTSMILLFIGTLISAAAPTFSFLLLGRLIQAAGAGIIMPLLMMVVFAVYPREGRGAAMGYIGLAMIFAPAIGPTIAGLVMEHFSWKWIFIGMLPLVALVIVLSSIHLINVSETSRSKLDITSVLLSTVGFGASIYGLSSAGDKGWTSPEVLFFIALGFFSIVLFCRRQSASDDPLLDLRVFKVPMYSITTVISILVMFIMYADMILLPLYLQTGRGFSVLDTALILLPGALVNAFLSPVSGKMLDRFGPKPIVFIGLLFMIPSIWAVTDLTDATSYTYLVIRTIFLRVGLSFLTMPLNTAGLNALPMHLNPHGSAVTNTIRQLAGSIGTALIITVFTVSTARHAASLQNSQEILPSSELARESAILATNDAYMFMLIIGISAFIATLFLGKAPDVEDAPATAPKS